MKMHKVLKKKIKFFVNEVNSQQNIVKYIQKKKQYSYHLLFEKAFQQFSFDALEYRPPRFHLLYLLASRIMRTLLPL